MKKVIKVVWMLLSSLFYAVCIAGFVGLLTQGTILMLSNWGTYPYLGYVGVATIAFFIAMCWVDRSNSQDYSNELPDKNPEDINKYKKSLKELDELDKQLLELENQRAKKDKE